jgi:hypothetical protein
MISFNQQYRLLGPNSNFNFQTSINVLISTDGNTWTPVYSQSGNTQSSNVINTAVNISSFISGVNSVQVKFQFRGSYFWWVIDDICLFRPNANDIDISETSFLPPPSVFTSPNHISEYTQYPLSMPPLLRYKAKATNNGFNSQNNIKLRGIVKRDSVQVSNTLSSLSINLGSLQNGQVQFSNNYSPPNTTPASFEVIYKLEQTEVDAVPENNSDTTTFAMTNNTLAKDRGAAEDPFDQGNENDNILRRDGNYFTISNVGNYCQGVRVGFDETTAPNTLVRAKIAQLFYNSEDETLTLGSTLATSNPFTVNAAHINFPGDQNLASILFPSPLALSNGATYFVSVEELSPQSEFGVARSGKSKNYSSTSSYDNLFSEILPSDTITVEVDTTFLQFDTLIVDGIEQIIETQIDSTIIVETILYDTTTIIQLDERISDKSFMIRMLMGYSTAPFGCTDATAVNYNSSAVNNDNSCYYQPGCTLESADNYNPLADYDNGSCQIAGCIDPDADNYLSYANLPDTCIYPPEGCTEPLAVNFDPEAVNDDGSCVILGCTDNDAANFVQEANTDDGSCLFRGCLDSLACNYDNNFDLNGNCIYPGCIDATACNFNSLAGCDDGSCCFGSCNQLEITYTTQAQIEWAMLLNGETIINGSGPTNSFVCNPSACNYEITLEQNELTTTPIQVVLTNQSGTVQKLFNINLSSADTTIQFGLGPVIFGCNDAMAINYNASATCNDGTCITYGCTNTTGVNFLPNATVDDGTCFYAGCTDVVASNYSDTVIVDNGSCLYPGCNDPLALNYDEEFNFNDGSCVYPVFGCTNPIAINFNPLADLNDGSCVIIGCTNSSAINFNPQANSDDGNCVIPGCTDSIANNYFPDANQNDGSCDYSAGCTNPTAIYFNPNAILDNGTCQILGCTNTSASNFNPIANIDDGTCQFFPSGCTDSTAFNFDPLAIVDNGSCDYLGCSDINACNYNPLATNTSNCIQPGDPCNDNSQSTSNDVIGLDCICAGQTSSILGCTTLTALNYNPNAQLDDGTCINQAPGLIAFASTGCSPFSTSITTNTNLPSDIECLWLINDTAVDATCENLDVVNLESGTYTITLQIGLVNPWTGMEGFMNSTTTLTVEDGAVHPNAIINSEEHTITCTNCENQIQWLNNGVVVGLGSTFSFFSNSLVQNGHYGLIHTSANGCISDTAQIIIAQTYVTSNLISGCEPLVLYLNSPIEILDGMTCSLTQNGSILQENFTGEFEVVLNSGGDYTFTQTCLYLDSISQSSVIVTVNEANTPTLVNNINLGIVECTNASLFDSLAWTIDGAFAGNGTSYPNSGIIYSCAGFGPGDCMNQSTINISELSVIGEGENSSNLIIFPNPTPGIVQLRTEETILSLAAIDQSGRIVALSANQLSLDLSNLIDGLYIIRIETLYDISYQRIELIHQK